MQTLQESLESVQTCLNFARLYANTKATLDKDERAAQENKLSEVQRDLALALQAKTEYRYAVRYHKVKFFERKKAMRRIKAMKKLIEQGDGSQHALDELEIDLYYTTHFPRSEKYISLWPNSPLEESKVLEKRTEIRDRLSKEMMTQGVSEEAMAAPSQRATQLIGNANMVPLGREK